MIYSNGVDRSGSGGHPLHWSMTIFARIQWCFTVFLIVLIGPLEHLEHRIGPVNSFKPSVAESRPQAVLLNRYAYVCCVLRSFEGHPNFFCDSAQEMHDESETEASSIVIAKESKRIRDISSDCDMRSQEKQLQTVVFVSNVF